MNLRLIRVFGFVDNNIYIEYVFVCFYTGSCWMGDIQGMKEPMIVSRSFESAANPNERFLPTDLIISPWIVSENNEDEFKMIGSNILHVFLTHNKVNFVSLSFTQSFNNLSFFVSNRTHHSCTYFSFDNAWTLDLR